MIIATYQGEKTVAELARRLFEETTTCEELAAAEKALVEANPVLAQISKLPRGSLLVVPASPGARSGEDLSPPTALVSNIVKELRPALEALRKTLDAAAKRESDELRETLSTLKNKELVQEAEKVPELKERLAKIPEAVKARQAGIKSEQAALKKTLARIEEDISKSERNSGRADADR